MTRSIEPIINKMDLVEFMITKYRKDFGRDISPIKLQKGLYFLYAMWGGKIRSLDFKSNSDSGEEYITEAKLPYSENLFDASFEAWGYGPVDRMVYVWYNQLSKQDLENINKDNIFIDDNIGGYIENLLDRIYASNDFGLVDLSHEDNSWKDVYDPKFKRPMSNESILLEYALNSKI